MPSLFWLDAARVYVAGVAIVEVDTSRVTPVVDVPTYADVSPAGAVWTDEDSLLVRPWSAALRTFVLPKSHMEAGVETVASRWATWLGDGRVLLVEQEVNAGLLACDVLDPAVGVWGPGTCPTGDFVQLGSIRAGPGDLYSIATSGEGHPGVTVARYSPERGQRAVPLPWTDLYPFGWLDVTFHRGGSVTLVTRCLLSDPDRRPCEGHTGDEQEWPLNAWRWRLGARTARLVAVDLPAGATVDPTGARYAWVTPGQVRVRRLDGDGWVSVKVPGLEP